MNDSDQSDEWWVGIAHAFSAHVREELGILEAYQRLAERTEDEGTRFLLGLILDDEHRHHELFERLASAARAESGAGVPAPPKPDAADRAELVAATERFLEVEREDAESLKRLRRELKPIADQTIWRLLVELMELDTEKHVKVLEYLHARLRSHHHDS